MTDCVMTMLILVTGIIGQMWAGLGSVTVLIGQNRAGRGTDTKQQCQAHVTAQSRKNWPHMGQIRDVFRSDFRTFWLSESNCSEI